MNTDTQSLQILRELTKQFSPEGKTYSQVVSALWQNYQANYQSNNNLNGTVFEEILGYTLTIANILPFYMQAKVAYVPNVNYDFICYDKRLGPISLSAKTSLRERWKQADLEAVALKYVHRNAKSYLITLDEAATRTRLDKLEECMGLNDFVFATSERFDQLVEELQQRSFSKSDTIDVVTSNIFIDQSSHHQRFGV